MTAVSLVPPPMSRTMLATGSPVGSPAPIAAAIGSKMSSTRLAPACFAASSTARRSTSVTPEGMQMTMCGRVNEPALMALRTKYLSMAAVTSKSAMTPSFNGRTAVMDSGVRPSISLAFLPMAKTSLEFASTATTDGSRSTMPSPRT